MIEITNLRKEYRVPSGTEVAVKGLDLSIEEGEFLSIIGPSGCGKTTTLRCIAGLETPTEGQIKINGDDVTDVPGNKRNLSMMFQNIALYPHMSVRDNIGYPLKVAKVPKDERNDQIEQAAELMQIPELLDKYPGELSGGQRQRAALARTIVQEPEAFLMDEPLSDLDAKLKVEMRREIQKIHSRIKKPTIYVTHDQEEAMTMSDRIVVMNDGEVEQVGSPDELYENPQNQFVANFIGTPTMNFLQGRFEDQGNGSVRITVQDESFELDASTVTVQPSSETVTLGFRPMTVTIGAQNGQPSLDGEVVLLERIGDRYLATIDCADDEIRATTSGEGLVEGNEVSIGLDTKKLYIFDSQTGDLILHDR